MASMVATAIYFLSRIALTPIILTYISLTEFGLWSICFVILSYAAMGAVGINTAYVKFTAQYHAEDNLKRINSLFSTGMLFMLLFVLLFYTTIHFIHPWLLGLFHVEPESMAIASFMVMGTTLVFCLDFTMGGFRSILEGLQEIAFTKSVNVGASVFEVILILIFLPLGMGIKGLLYAYGIKTVAEILICTLFVFKKLPGFSIRFSLINTAAFKELFVYVGKVQVLAAFGIFNASLDRFVIASFMGLTGAGLFEIGRKFPFTGKNISHAAFGPFFPAASYLGGQWKRGDLMPIPIRIRKYAFLFIISLLLGMVPVLIIYIANPEEHRLPWGLLYALIGFITVASIPILKWLYQNFKEEDQLFETELKTFYLKGLRLLAMLNATVFGFLMAVATPLIICWVGHEYLAAVGVMVIFSITNMIHLCTGPASLIFRGINRSGREFEYLIIQLMTALLWIPMGTHFMGILGASLGVFASATVGSLFIFLRTNQAFNISFKHFFKTVVTPTLAPLSVTMGIYGITLILSVQSRIMAGVEVMVLGMFHLALTIVLLWKYFLTIDETTSLMNMIKHRLPGKSRG